MFREIHSGLIYEYDIPYDIDQMRKHPDYSEVLETKIETQELSDKVKHTAGRPAKSSKE